MTRGRVSGLAARRRQSLGLLAVLLSSLPLAGCGVDPDQARQCRELIAAFEPNAVQLLASEPADRAGYAVEVRYRPLGEGSKAGAERWIVCGFAQEGFGSGRLELVAVATSQTGPLDDTALFWLKEWHEIYRRSALVPAAPEAREATPAPRAQDPRVAWLYALQQAINALALACVYALLAVSFTLVYGLVRQINFAFGELYMLSAVSAALWSAMLAAAGLAGWPGAVALVLSVGLITATAYGWVMGRLVFRPLRGARGHAVLIAAIGLSIALQEAVRLLQGARDFWLPADFRLTFVLAEAAGFTLVASWKQVAVALLALAVLGALSWLILRSRFGRAYRACADDATGAALVGVDSGRVMAVTFALAGALAGTAGFMLFEYYGVANFFMGFMTGFKALTAAILGGIGSLPGAAVGALLIAVLETFWAGYLDSDYRDVAVFAVLAVVLILRPSGLLGHEPAGIAPPRR